MNGRYHIIILILLIALAACQPTPNTPHQPGRYDLNSFTKNDVTVTTAIEIASEGDATLIATFTPLEPTLHLYSMELPPKGIDGIGRPTRLELVSGKLEAAGAVSADVTAVSHTIPNFDQPFPLYPDGPVTLTLPVQLPLTQPELRDAEISLTYMACSSDGGCKPPVTDYRLNISLPEQIWR